MKYFRYIRNLVEKHFEDDGILVNIGTGRQNLSANVGNDEQFNIQAAFAVGKLQVSYPRLESWNVGSIGRPVR